MAAAMAWRERRTSKPSAGDHAPTPQAARAALRCTPRTRRASSAGLSAGAARAPGASAIAARSAPELRGWRVGRKRCAGRAARSAGRRRGTTLGGEAQAVGAQPLRRVVRWLRDDAAQADPPHPCSPCALAVRTLAQRHARLPLRSTPAVTRLVSVASTDIKSRSEVIRAALPQHCASLQHQLPLPHVVSPLANELRSEKHASAAAKPDKHAHA